MHAFSRRTLALSASAALLLAACGGADDTSTNDPAAEQSTAPSDTTDGEMTDGDMTEGDMTDGEMHDGEDAMGDYTSSAVVESVATRADGSTVRIADFAGKVVFVETFATWCSTCRSQLRQTDAAAEQVGDDAVFLILSVEADLPPADLADYAQKNGFTNVEFAVLSREGLVAFDEAFGRSVLNAPSTPKFVVAADGTVGEMTTGKESVEQILAHLQRA